MIQLSVQPHLKRVVMVVFSMVLAACGSNPATLSELRFEQPDSNYVIGPGDTMEIFVWGNEELTTSSIVRPDGKFTTRLVEDLQASGKTPTALAREI